VLRITNVGFRLLRSRARVEPPDARWVRVLPPFDAGDFLTIDETELPLEIEIPEGLGRTHDAEIVLEWNGGIRRVPVSVGAPKQPMVVPDFFEASPGLAGAGLVRPLADTIRTVPAPARVVAGIAVALAVRSAIFAASLLPVGATAVGPSLTAIAIFCAGVGSVLGLATGWRKSNNAQDAAMSAIAAALAGILAAALLHAFVRTIEAPIGSGNLSTVTVGLVWAALGCAVAGLTVLIVPYRAPTGETPR
jgi:hypothetical protein